MGSTARTGMAVHALVVLLGAAVFLNYVDRGAISVAAPLMNTALGLSAFEYGIAVSAFFWVYGPLQLVVGWLCDRFSVYRLLAWGVGLWALATLLSGFVAGFVSLVILRTLLGIGGSLAFPASSKIIAEHVPPEGRGMANASVSIGIALGPAVGILAGGIILESMGWRSVFILFGLATLLWLVPWRLTTRTVTAAAPVERPRVPLGPLLRTWSLWSMTIAHFASNYGFYFLLSWLPLYLTKQRGLSIAEMTALGTLAFAAQALAAFAIGTVSDRFTRSGRSEATVRRWMMIVGQLVQAVAVVGVLWADTTAELAIWLCVAGMATGSLSLNIFAVAQMFAGKAAAGTWVGFQNALGNFSGIFGPLITGWIVDRAGYDNAFFVCAAIVAAGGFWWIVGVPKIRQYDLKVGQERVFD